VITCGMNQNELHRFREKYYICDDGHWLWTANTDKDGYAIFGISGKNGKAHRISYAHYVGEIPDGFQIDHLCRIKNCVNPEHLEAVTPRENTMRGNTAARWNAEKTHCVRGHPFDEENTVPQPGGRSCRECGRARSREWYHRNKSVAAIALLSQNETPS